MYPLTFLKEMYDLDEAAKRESGIWDAEHSPQHDSYVTRDLGIKEEYFVFYNPYDDEDVGKLRKWMGMVQQFSNERGVVWTAQASGSAGTTGISRCASSLTKACSSRIAALLQRPGR